MKQTKYLEKFYNEKIKSEWICPFNKLAEKDKVKLLKTFSYSVFAFEQSILDLKRSLIKAWRKLNF
jgi:hypothetical protein